MQSCRKRLACQTCAGLFAQFPGERQRQSKKQEERGNRHGNIQEPCKRVTGEQSEGTLRKNSAINIALQMFLHT